MLAANELSIARKVMQGELHDPFSFLGLHCIDKNLIRIRVFKPGAIKVSVPAQLSVKSTFELTRVGDTDVFVGDIKSELNSIPIKFNVDYPGIESNVHDAYCFLPSLDNQALYLFNQGTLQQGYRFFGSHAKTVDDVDGYHFLVWAPNAQAVSVVGDFNHWDARQHSMRYHLESGVWDIFIPDIKAGNHYKYSILGADNVRREKADPYAKRMQHPPQTASILAAPSAFKWQDQQWLEKRAKTDWYHSPVSIYEVHLGSWKRKHDAGNQYLTFEEFTEQLIPYVLELGFTHIQLMPVSEYPFDGSWGYQPVGMFASSSRFGTPDQMKFFIDQCHQNNIAVLIDWVPGHFPVDEYGLGQFDGTCLYEHEDVRRGFHPDWNTLIYNYGRCEIQSFLLSNALFWLDEFHIDGLRVDAVASMLYLDYSRDEGEWVPNEHGGRENLEAIALLQKVNAACYQAFPGILMIAEESTAWPGVSRPIEQQGLGFGYKWNMGWMNDSLEYMEKDPIYRKHHHDQLTFSMVYAFSENFILPISHDEVVHGKGSLINKMPGDDWQKFANLRTFYAYMWMHPGKKLLFMGGEWGQRNEWDHDKGLDWFLLEQSAHQGIRRLIRDLNRVYAHYPVLYQGDHQPSGFNWINSSQSEQSIFSFYRTSDQSNQYACVIVNMTPACHRGFRLGVPVDGLYHNAINTDKSVYGGSDVHAESKLKAESICENGLEYSIMFDLPPLACLVYLCEGDHR